MHNEDEVYESEDRPRAPKELLQKLIERREEIQMRLTNLDVAIELLQASPTLAEVYTKLRIAERY